MSADVTADEFFMSLRSSVRQRKRMQWDTISMPSAFGTGGEVIRCGLPNISYRCIMYKCQHPVWYWGGAFWHKKDTACTHDLTYIRLIQSSINHEKWYTLKCSVCTNEALPFTWKRSSILLSGKRMPRRSRVGDVTLSIYQLLNAATEYGSPYQTDNSIEFRDPLRTVINRLFGSDGLCITASLVDVSRYSGDCPERSIPCHVTNGILRCVECMARRMNRQQVCGGCKLNFMQTKRTPRGLCGRCILICKHCELPRRADQMASEVTCSKCADEYTRLLDMGVEVELHDLTIDFGVKLRKR